MKTALVLSRCECQATLGAAINEQGVVVHGFARDPRRQRELAAPANATQIGDERFNVGWFCPFCIRNSLRSFDKSTLAYREPAEASSPPAP